MTQPKPGFYAGTLIFSVSSIALLASMLVVCRRDSGIRERYGVFVAAFAVGCVAVVGNALASILAHEKAAFGPRPGPHIDAASCPDTHVRVDGTDTCTPDAGATLSLDSDDDARYESVGSVRYRYAPTVVDFEAPLDRSLSKADVEKLCASAPLKSLPYTRFRPYCGE
jgi:hypothetical protein